LGISCVHAMGWADMTAHTHQSDSGHAL
jgi:hypothetical protein